MKIGIYKIKNKINNKVYIGSSKNLTKRMRLHRQRLNGNYHENRYLQSSWLKHGETNFHIEIIEICDVDILLDREAYWIEFYKSYNKDFGYNICRIPKHTRLGLRASPETLLKMSIANGGQNHPNWGKKLSQTHIINMSIGNLGVKRPNSGRKKCYKIINPNGETIEIFGLRKFCRDNNLSVVSIFKIVNGKQLEHRGYRTTEIIPTKIDNINKKYFKRSVVCSFKDGERIFNSIKEASESNLFDKVIFQQNISNCCQGKQKYCGKIRGNKVYWRYLS